LGLEEGDSLYDDIPSISSVAANKHALNGRWNASDEEITFSGKLQETLSFTIFQMPQSLLKVLMRLMVMVVVMRGKTA
jgi:hypothetical protein